MRMTEKYKYLDVTTLFPIHLTTHPLTFFLTHLDNINAMMTERKEREKTANDDLYCLHPPAMLGHFGGSHNIHGNQHNQHN